MRRSLILGLFAAVLASAQDKLDPILSYPDRVPQARYLGTVPNATAPKVISRIEPKLPNVPLRGPVVLLVTVDIKGLPAKIRVMNSSDRTVDKAVIEAVQKWRFQPGTKNGVPAEMPVVVSIPAKEHQQ